MKIKDTNNCLFTKALAVAISDDAIQIKASGAYTMIFVDGSTLPCDATTYVNSLLIASLPGVGGHRCVLD